MSVEAEPRPARAEPRPRPRSGFELWAWLFMRLSGILLLFLAVGHVLIMHVIDEGVQRVDFDFVADRWASPFWRTWDWMLLSLALLHGINGTRVVIQDHVRSPGWRLTWNSIFVIVGFALFVLGSVIVFTFDAAEFSFS
ncbi:MAG TPA: succinate dehydrogenase hydrophobic membrane anchor subunit [Actinomycetota bacterium]